MLKSFIIAATSLAYVLCIPNIADAKNKALAKKNEREYVCLNQKPSSKDISSSEIKNICRELTRLFKEKNEKSDPRTGLIIAHEVISLKIVSVSRNVVLDNFKGSVARDIAEVEIRYIFRDFKKSGDKWIESESGRQGKFLKLHKNLLTNKWSSEDI